MNNTNTLYGYHSYPNNWEFLGGENATPDPHCNKVIYTGIELETEEQDNATASREEAADHIYELMEHKCYCAGDGSLRNYGVEIISYPFSKEYQDIMFNNINKVMEYLKSVNFRSHDGGRCGLHIHFTRPFDKGTEADQEFLNKLYFIFESFKEPLKMISRRTNYNYCCFWSDSTRFTDPRELKSLVKIAEKEKPTGHDVAINNANNNTIEIRFLRGTLNYNTFVQSFNIIYNLFMLAFKDIKELNNLSFKKVLTDPDQKKYALSRGVDLNVKIFDYSKILLRLEKQTNDILLKSNKYMNKLINIILNDIKKDKLIYKDKTNKKTAAENYINALNNKLYMINNINDVINYINEYINKLSSYYTYNELIDKVKKVCQYRYDNRAFKDIQKKMQVITTIEL